MTVTIKIGRKEGFISTYNLFFPDGLRLQTKDLTFASAEDRKLIKIQFQSVVDALRSVGWIIEGEVE